jgi:hypothetical protein
MHIGIIFYFNKLGGFLNGSRKTDYWFKGKEVAGKITLKDLETKGFMPIIYARKMCEKLVC